ncbi:hypothetical protein OKW24_004384 [Peribacillus simplex]|nr:hypothetical protein [Peribacillus simplex]
MLDSENRRVNKNNGFINMPTLEIAIEMFRGIHNEIQQE